MMFPKVLLACPTSQHKTYCQSDWVANVKNLTYPNLEILIVDNSRDSKNAIELKRLFEGCKHKWQVINSEPKETVCDTLVDCCNKIRQYVLKEKFDYWFSLESDLFPPVNIIEYLLAFQKPLVCATYFTFGGDSTLLLNHEMLRIGKFPYVQIKTMLNTFINDVKDKGVLKPTLQAGMGCLMVKANVLRKVMFRYDANEFKAGYHDYFFLMDLYRLGYTVYSDFSVIIEHRNNSKRWDKILEIEKTK